MIDEIYAEVKRTVAPAIDLLLEYQSEYEDLLEVDLGYDPEDVEPLTTNLEDILLYFGEIFDWADEDGFYFLPEQDEKGRAKLQNAHESYAYYGTERPLILYDSTLGRSGRDGFLVTDRYLYLKNEPFPKKRTRKYQKKRNESLSFCGILVYAA